jgi:hypothetical protein
MVDALSGFSPRLQAALRAAGVGPGLNQGWAAGVTNPGWGTYTMKDLEAQRFAMSTNSPNNAPVVDVVAPHDQAASVFGGVSMDTLNQQRQVVSKLYSQYQRAAQQEAARQAAVPAPHPSLWARVMSVLSRPGQFVEGLLYGQKASDYTAPGYNPAAGGGISEHLKSAVSGFTGKQHFSVAQELRNSGIRNKWVDAIGGLVGDVALDPTSYVGVGIAKHVATDVPKAVATAEALKGLGQGEDVAAKLGANIAAGGQALSRRALAAATKTGQETIDQIAQQAGFDAARTAKAALTTDLIKVGMPKGQAAKNATRWLNPAYAGSEAMVRNSAPWFTKIMESPDTLKSAVDTTVEKVAQEAQQNTARQLTELLTANLDQQVRRSLRVTLGGIPILKTPLPQGVQSALASAAKVDLVGRTLDAFDKTFHTGTRFDNALTVVKARAAGLAQRRIDVGRQAILDAFNGVDTEGRRAFMEALATGPRDALGHGVARSAAGADVADPVASMLSDMGKYVDWKGDGSGLLSIDDLNRYLPGKKGPNSKGTYLKFDKRTILRNPDKVTAAAISQGGRRWSPAELGVQRIPTAEEARWGPISEGGPHVAGEGQGNLFPDVTPAQVADVPSLTSVPERPVGPGQESLFPVEPTATSALKQLPVRSFVDLIKANGDYLRHVDPAKFMFALHVATEKALARDQLGRALREWGVPLNSSALARDPLTGKWTAGKASPAAQELIDKHGYEPIHTKGHSQEASGFYGRHLDGLVFAPEVKKGLLRVIQIADHEEKRGEVLRAYDRTQGMLKKLLTLPTPSFHIRNSFGDFMTGTLDGVFGPRGMASYDQALRTMTSLRRTAKPFSENTPSALTAALLAPVNPQTGQAPSAVEALAGLLSKQPEAAGAGRRIMKAPRNWPDAPGGYLTDAQLWAAYSHAGLNQGFVNGDLAAEQALGNPNALRPFEAVQKAGDAAMKLSAARENFFRLAHFIDRLKRSSAPTLAQAAEEAAYYVRKFHFDYTDVTPTEQALFARLIPFYKWQRFATPLMLQTFFAKPGAILNWQRAQVALSQGAFGGSFDNNMLPTSDQILPQYFTDNMMYPLYHSAHGNSVYMNMGIPSTQIFSNTLGLSSGSPGGILKNAFGNVVSSSSPIISAPYELATGRRAYGGGQIPTGPAWQYLLSRFGGPVPTLESNFTKPDFSTRVLSALSGLGLSENTPARQSAYLNELLREIRTNRKKAGYVAPKKSAGPGASRPGGSSAKPGGG